MWFYVYILQCSNDKLNIGCTSDIHERFDRHNKGHVPATKNILPVKLIAALSVPDKNLAYRLEKYLKSGSGRAFINKQLRSTASADVIRQPVDEEEPGQTEKNYFRTLRR